MYIIIYGVVFFLGIICMVYMSTQTYQKIDRSYWTMIVLLQFVNFGYFSLSLAQTLEEAFLANTLLYVGGSLLPTVFVIALLNALKFRITDLFKLIVYSFSIILLVVVYVGERAGLYYSKVVLNLTRKGTILKTEPGFFATIHDIYVVILMVVIVVAFVIAIRRGNVMHTVVARSYLSISILVSVTYIINHYLKLDFELLPEVYLLCAWVAAIGYNRNLVYDIEGIVSSKSEKSENAQGYAVLNLNQKMLGTTARAVELIPELDEISKNTIVNKSANNISSVLCELIENLEEGKEKEQYIKIGEKTCKITVSFFSFRKDGKTSGYIFEIVDDTQRQQYMDFVENYNDVLKKEVMLQTEHTKEIQGRVVVGLANMVENRDNNTGGHVKRTSDIVRILVETMIEKGIGSIESQFAEDIIRAAPMHDLGKIVIDSSILCKPGKLTDEEYTIMKTHAPKSGEIVLSILDGVEEKHFVDVAYNVARHHHERYDGKGYPDGLAAEAIPIEARIMAIADVYDALVSKRCYKEAMSFEKAYEVMIENMGTQFDPNLEQVFNLCREQLEDYYKNN